MKILVIGYSDIAQRRAIPALQALPDAQLAVATRSRTRQQVTGALGFFSDYQQALDEFRPDLAYVSLANSQHEYWAGQALLAGAHVVVDKPAFTTLAAARRLAALAGRQHRCLAEATVYAWHPQVALLQQLFRDAGSAPTRLTATFAFPGLAAGNFRYQVDQGGGALLDLGPYAVSLGRIFFGEDPTTVHCRILSRHASGVDSAFSVMMGYPGGRSMLGHFDFNAPYCNRLQLMGAELAIDIERLFTTPADWQNPLVVHYRDRQERVIAPVGDAFAVFFREVAVAIERDDIRRFADDLLRDAAARDRLQLSAQEP